MAVRLEHIVDEYREAVAVTWRSFLLRPTPAALPFERFRAYTQSWLRPASQAGGGRFRVWSTEESPPSHSVPPQVALKAAARQGGFDRYHTAIMDVYFWDNRNVTATGTLVEIAARVGLEPGRFEHDLRDPVLEREVLGDYHEAMERGITAVPTVLVDEWQIPGSQDLEFYRRVIDRRLSVGRGEA